MSVCRIVLRLEVADNTSEVLADIQYTAPTYDINFKSTYASKVGAIKQQTPPPVVHLIRKQIDVFKGRREFQLLTIETHTDITEAAEMASSELDVSNGQCVLPLCEESRHPGCDASPHSHSSDLRAVASLSVQGQWPVQQTTDDSSRKLVHVGTHDEVRPGSGKLRSKGTTIRFFSGNPSVERTEGILHLYKEDHMTLMTGDVPRSEMICMLNISATFTSQDLLQFLAPVMKPGVEHIKIIRDTSPNQYMALVKFRQQTFADEAYQTFNNRPFNSIEPEICHMAYVARVESMRSSEGAGMQIAGVTELPVCTVCLERMDESVQGVLTILCNHSFHGECLARWDDTSCPVCRYIQTPLPVPDNKCFECSAQENLWICLVCGFVGCSRYQEGHAYSHFKETYHTYSMQLGSNRVWDYTGDNYVHRLVQNKTDGKLVEVDERGNVVQEDKMDSLALEYTYLLTSQLESQRHFFEEKITHLELQTIRQVEEVEARMKKALEECTKRDQQLAVAAKEKQAAEKRCTVLTAKLTKTTADLVDEKQMNRSLRENQLQFQSRITELEDRLSKKDEEMAELQEQLRDVMFYLEAKQTLSTTSEATQQEIQEGQIVVQPSSSPGGATAAAAERAKKTRKKGRNS